LIVYLFDLNHLLR